MQINAGNNGNADENTNQRNINVVKLRNFKENDANILRQNWNTNMSIEEIQNMICDWKKHEFKGKYFEMFAIIKDDEIAGMLSLYQHSDSVISIAPEVFPEFQRQGIGKKAMLIALEIVKSKGYKIVLQQVRSDNIPSIALHLSLGFETDKYGYGNKKGNEVFLFLKAL